MPTRRGWGKNAGKWLAETVTGIFDEPCTPARASDPPASKVMINATVQKWWCRVNCYASFDRLFIVKGSENW